MISEEDVRKIARLARLRISPDEVRLYQSQLERILDSMAELSALETGSVEPTHSVLGLSAPQRDDVPRSYADAEALVAAAPRRDGPYFKVRKVLE